MVTERHSTFTAEPLPAAVSPKSDMLHDVLKEILSELEKEICHYRSQNSAIEELRKEREAVSG